VKSCFSTSFLVFHHMSASVKRRQLDRNQLVMRLFEIIFEIFFCGREGEALQPFPVSLIWRGAIHSEEALNYFSVINSHREIRGTSIHSAFPESSWIFNGWRRLYFTRLSLFLLSAVRRNYHHYSVIKMLVTYMFGRIEGSLATRLNLYSPSRLARIPSFSFSR